FLIKNCKSQQIIFYTIQNGNKERNESMFGKVNCIAAAGIDGYVVEVEADVANRLPSFDMVGFLASEVKEAKERVRTALRNSGYSMPRSEERRVGKECRSR